MAAHIVAALPLREEGSSPDALLAVAAGEAALVPDSLLVLHVLISCHNWLEQPLYLGESSRLVLLLHRVVLSTERSCWPRGAGTWHNKSRCYSNEGSYSVPPWSSYHWACSIPRRCWRRTCQSTSGSIGGHPFPHTSSPTGCPCSNGSQTSQLWCPPCAWRDLMLDVWTMGYIQQGLDIVVNNF